VTATISPPMFTQFLNPNNSGAPAAGFKLFTYIAGTSTKQATWTDSTQSVQNANPLVLDASGGGYVWGDPTLAYKFVWAPATDTDPPSSPIRSVDNIRFPLTYDLLTQVLIGTLLYPQTPGEQAAGVVPVNYYYQPGDARRYGCTANDGSTDESAQLQNAVNANKGGLVYIPQGLTVYAAGILLDGSSYNGTTLDVRGTFRLKASGGLTNFQSVCWGGIIFHSVTRFTLIVHDLDGNRSAQPDNEHIFCVIVSGCTSFEIPYFSCREIRGDGIYFGQSTFASSSTDNTDGKIGQVYGTNSADDGRNLISIISLVRFSIDQLQSYLIGGFVDSTLQPGGLDIEPDHGYQNVADGVIGAVNVVTSGNGGFQISGKAVTSDAARDWNVRRINVGRVSVQRTSSLTGFVAATVIQRCASIQIGEYRMYRSGTAGAGFNVLLADLLYGVFHCDNVTTGMSVGSSFGTGSVSGSYIELYANTFTLRALLLVSANLCRFRGRAINSVAGTVFGVEFNTLGTPSTVSNCMFSFDAPQDGNFTRACRTDPVNTPTITNVMAHDCDWSGYASFSVCCDAQVNKANVRGMNYASAQPANGTWVIGDIVYNSAPALAAGKVTVGWTRLTTGNANVTNTDWAAQVVPNA